MSPTILKFIALHELGNDPVCMTDSTSGHPARLLRQAYARCARPLPYLPNPETQTTRELPTLFLSQAPGPA